MDRFKKVYSQGVISVIEIWIDTETGVKCFTGTEMQEGLRRCLMRRESPW